MALLTELGNGWEEKIRVRCRRPLPLSRAVGLPKRQGAAALQDLAEFRPFMGSLHGGTNAHRDHEEKQARFPVLVVVLVLAIELG